MKRSIFEGAGANLAASLRITLVTITLCGGLYPLAIRGFAVVAAPELAAGSLVRDQSGNVIGSRLVAQAFNRPEYFWPRPSAVSYDASASGGSNLSPAGPEVRQRAVKSVAAYCADAKRPLPADLVTTSGSGLDPDITPEAALYQVARVANARRLDRSAVEALVRRQVDGGRIPFSGKPLVNVLTLNMALDAMQKSSSTY
jgi:K+-transporting ATPase ATPase C chain